MQVYPCRQFSLVRLGDIVSAQVGFASGARDDSGVVQVRMHNLSPEFVFVWNKIIRVPVSSELPEKYQLAKGDIIFNNTNSTELVGKSALFSAFPEPISFSNHMTRLRVDKTVCTPEYLVAWLRWQWQQGVFARLCTRWIGQSAIRSRKLLDLEISLPPLAEQKRIIKPLSANLRRAAKMKTAMQAQAEIIDVLPHSILSCAFPRKLKVQLGEIANLTRGVTYSKNDEVNMGGICILRANNIDRTSSTLNLSGIRRVRASVNPPAEKKLQQGDIFICLASGSKAHLGKVAMIEQDMDFYFGGFMGVVRVRKGTVDSRYLFYQLRTQAFNAFLSRRISGTNINNLSARILEEFEISLPPLAEQRIITRMLKAKMKAAAKLQSAAQVQLDAVEALPAALLHRAFSSQ